MAKFIEIKKQGENLIWLVESNVGYNSEVIITEGCQALVLCDGAIIDNLYSGHHKINVKGFLSRSDGKIWSVYGVNSSDLFELPWGCQTKHKDTEYDIVVTLRMSGEVIAKIENGSKLFRTIELKDNVITKVMLEEQFRKKLIDEVQNCVGQVTREVVGDYLITDIKGQIADKLRDTLKKALRDRYGLNITDALVRINSCEELETIWELKRKAAASEIQKDIYKSTGEGMKAIADGINAMTPVQPQPEKEKEKEEKGKIELIIK